tara:strand:- start:6676 stop:7116 length:441 start_codon:yes stop_codon:yes gene_type:complete
MKVILLQDVAKIGKRSDVVEVPDGYALNQLIPKKMAEPATAGNQKRIERMQADAAANKEADRARFSAAQTALTEKKLEIAAEANELGHLFKAVNESDIADAAQAAGVDIEAAMVVVGTPIKEVGEHTVSLVRSDDKAEFAIEVIKK